MRSGIIFVIAFIAGFVLMDIIRYLADYEGLMVWGFVKSFVSTIFYEIILIRPNIYMRKKGFNPHQVTFNNFIKCLDSNEIAEFRKTFPKSQLYKFDTLVKRMER